MATSKLQQPIESVTSVTSTTSSDSRFQDISISLRKNGRIVTGNIGIIIATSISAWNFIKIGTVSVPPIETVNINGITDNGTWGMIEIRTDGEIWFNSLSNTQVTGHAYRFGGITYITKNA